MRHPHDCAGVVGADAPVEADRQDDQERRHMVAATRSAAAVSSSSVTFGSTSSQIGSAIPDASTIPSGRGRNQTWKCAPPSPQRYRWTRATSPSARIARSTRAATRPKSACSSSGRSEKESTWTRLASQTAPGRLPPTGGCSVQLSSDHTAAVVLPLQIRQGGPPGSPRRGGSGIWRSPGWRGVNGSRYGSVMLISAVPLEWFVGGEEQPPVDRQRQSGE